MASWDELLVELERWKIAGRTATFWWRDDDAVQISKPLDRLCNLSERYHAPVALAVIPAAAKTGLLKHGDWPLGAAIVQHGFRHANHAPPAEKKAEFGGHRELTAMLDEIAEGWRVIAKAASALAVFVPPWNRIDRLLASRLPEIGLRGLSAFGPRASRETEGGGVQCNTHVDPIDWHGGRGYAGDERALAQCVAHLAARREGRADADEPTGLLTHHLVHDEKCWHFVEALLKTVTSHEACRWLAADEVFA